MASESPPPLPDEAPPHTVMVVDDEKNIRRTLRMTLEGDYDIVEADSAEAAQAMLQKAATPIDLIILDMMLPKMSGLELLAKVKQNPLFRHIPVIVISGHASSEEAAEAIKLGAIDFLEKPVTGDNVRTRASNALKNTVLMRRLALLAAAAGPRHTMIGDTAVMQKLYRDIARVAPTKANVLITGPSGTGKELISRAIHEESTRNDKSFVKVNCAAIPRELIESELFGHEKGAFTGAEKNKRGLFEQAHGGTMFLDEIGDMDLTAQAKVLRVLQSGELQRVGSEHTFTVDCRVLAATNKDLAKEVKEGRFREDLFFRLNVFPIKVPTLDQRKDDIPVLAEAFMRAFCEENGLKPKPMSSAVFAALTARSWPGNVRELKNVVERAAILSGDEITIADLPEDPHADPFDDTPRTSPRIKADGTRPTLRELREQAERQHIIATLVEFEWNVSRAAVALGVERTNLHKKIRAYGIQRGETS